MTNATKLDLIIEDQDWHNYEDRDGKLWDVCQVLFNKMQMLKESLQDLAAENGDDLNELENHVKAIHDVQTILGFLDEEKLKELTAECAYCHAPMNTIIRGHHHTENGVDVTK